MNRNFEGCPEAATGGKERRRHVVARTIERMQAWFRRVDPEQASMRFEERNWERARLARELHDTLFPSFLGVSLQLNQAVQYFPADSPSRLSFSRIQGLMQRAIDEGRDSLQPRRASGPASMSLEQALSGICEEFTPEAVKLRIFVSGRPRSLNPRIQEQIYWIGREAVLNALRHAEASSIEAEVRYLPRGLRLAVRDNGRGMDPRAVRSVCDAHGGLVGMRERAGAIGAELKIWSRPGAGTEVEISVPGGSLTELGA
jgi:signal transduction histidine kinase